MKIYEIGTGYTSIPTKISAATELIVEELTKSMIKKKIDVNIIDVKDENRTPNNLPIIEIKMPKKFIATDVKLGILHKMKRVIYSINLSKKIKKILSQETDTNSEKVVLHFHNQYNLYFFLHLTSKKIRKKCIIAYTIHSGIWNLDWEDIKKIVKRKYFQEAYCIKNADLVFSLNSITHKNILKYLNVDENKIVDIANGVNTNIYKPLDNKIISKELINKNFDGKTIILQVGSIYENKGQLRSIIDLEPLLKNNKNVMYVFVGGIVSQDYYQKILSEVKNRKLESQVKYLGMITPGEELCKLYNLATATIMSSEYEAFGLVAIESLSCGVPVLLKKDSKLYYGNGSIYYDNDINKTITEDILKDNDIKDKCRNNAIKNYSWDAIANKYLEEFRKN